MDAKETLRKIIAGTLACMDCLETPLYDSVSAYRETIINVVRHSMELISALCSAQSLAAPDKEEAASVDFGKEPSDEDDIIKEARGFLANCARQIEQQGEMSRLLYTKMEVRAQTMAFVLQRNMESPRKE